MAGKKAEHSTFSATVMLPFRAIVSKPAQKSYIGIAFFLLISCGLFCLSVVSYWVFYNNYVPQISLERPVHLQYGKGNPNGTALLRSGLAYSQPYDVSVILSLPSTPANRAAGNFMVDLAFLPALHNADSKVSTSTALVSKRPASLTYTSPMVDVARRLWRLPLYVLGWKLEAEELKIVMMEQMKFHKSSRAIPDILRLELHNENPVQVYSATVKFDARFTGLKWVMYNWRITSFLMFSSAFWVFSMMVTCAVWVVLANSGHDSSDVKAIKGEEYSDDEWDEGQEDIKVRSGHTIQGGASETSGESTPRRSTSASRERDTAKVKKEEDIEETAAIDPLIPIAEREDEEDHSEGGSQSRS